MTTLMNLPQGFDPAFAPQSAQVGASPNNAMLPWASGMPGGGMQATAGPNGQMRIGAGLLQPQQMNSKMASQTTEGEGETLTEWATGKVPTTTNPDGSWKGFGDFFGGLGEWLSGSAGAIAGIGSIAGALDNANDTRQLGVGIQAYLDSLGSQLNTGSQFQGYGVTTGLGNSSVGQQQMKDAQGNLMVDADGNPVMQQVTNLGMNDAYADYDWGEAGAPQGYVAGMNGLAQQAANSAYGTANTLTQQAGMSVADRQNAIYKDIMATQNPELNRMQTEQQAAEYARGRGGVRGSQYGGTAEDAAMARARAMASNDATFRAREMANNERGMLGQLAGQFGSYGNQAAQAAYLPMQQQMAMLGLGQKDADMAQTGQLTGLDYMAQLALGGTNANMQAQHSANQLTGNIYDTIFSNIGGAQGSDGGSASGLLGGIGGGLDWLAKALGFED